MEFAAADANAMQGLVPLLAAMMSFAQGLVLPAFAIFVRVGAICALLPAFGEQFIPVRVRLALALAITVILAPALAPVSPPLPDSAPALAALVLGETAVGLVIGIGLRLVVFVLQIAGSVAAQGMSIAQMDGAGVTPDPSPAVANLFVLSGLALAVTLGLHVKVVMAISQSYVLAPAGWLPDGAGLGEWGLAHVVRAFNIAFSLSAPFLAVALVYNIALGAINRAMPQLMVSFVGAPAITGVMLVLLLITLPAALTVWAETLDGVLGAPLDLP
jgi:flagellar biosynthetic protein FliR